MIKLIKRILWLITTVILVLSVVVILFALSTLISWAYYGQKAWTFLVGEGHKRNLSFNIIYCLFIIIGSAMNVASVINITNRVKR